MQAEERLIQMGEALLRMEEERKREAESRQAAEAEAARLLEEIQRLRQQRDPE